MFKMFMPSYLPDFRRDIQAIVAWSEDQIAGLAVDGYGRLIRQALRDVLEEPTRSGAKARPDLAPHAYVYPMKFSRERVDGERVKAVRHFVLYRCLGQKVEFGRLLHDSRDLTLPLAAELRTSRCGTHLSPRDLK